MAKEKKPHKCPYESCKSSFNRPYRLAQHVLVHQNVKTFICTEEGCGKSYTSKSHLDRHVTTVHLSPEKDVIYSCPQCLKHFANRQNLKRHMNVYHAKKIRYLCDLCKKDFLKKHQLTAHIYQHTGVKAFSCDICNKELVSLYEKRKHMRTHKEYTCEDCSMKFNYWSKYQKHKKLEHTFLEYICNECDRNFKHRNHIQRHMKTHFPGKEVFHCTHENCTRFYSRISNLRQHILIKHEKLSHECTICGAQLSTKAKLNEHIKRHTQSQDKKHVVKTKENGRKPRKDKGSMKMSTALKIAGIPIEPDCEIKSENLFQNIISKLHVN